MNKYVKDELFMENERRIKDFNRENRPFYIVDHDDGTFALCLPFDLLTGQYANYCQVAFDNYAKLIGHPMYNSIRIHCIQVLWLQHFRHRLT